mmetsp:Transcript_9747/g.5781  ORF Transcript_9747/g.5781 Transcript_9747/m.5781 type:complete len:91 (+) Transcript_9747:17-289(+)
MVPVGVGATVGAPGATRGGAGGRGTVGGIICANFADLHSLAACVASRWKSAAGTYGLLSALRWLPTKQARRNASACVRQAEGCWHSITRS